MANPGEAWGGVCTTGSPLSVSRTSPFLDPTSPGGEMVFGQGTWSHPSKPPGERTMVISPDIGHVVVPTPFDGARRCIHRGGGGEASHSYLWVNKSPCASGVLTDVHRHADVGPSPHLPSIHPTNRGNARKGGTPANRPREGNQGRTPTTAQTYRRMEAYIQAMTYPKNAQITRINDDNKFTSITNKITA